MKLERDGVRCVKPVRWVKRVKRLELKEIGVVFGNLRVGLWDPQLRNVRSGIARDLTIFMILLVISLRSYQLVVSHVIRLK